MFNVILYSCRLPILYKINNTISLTSKEMCPHFYAELTWSVHSLALRVLIERTLQRKTAALGCSYGEKKAFFQIHSDNSQDASNNPLHVRPGNSQILHVRRSMDLIGCPQKFVIGDNLRLSERLKSQLSAKKPELPLRLLFKQKQKEGQLRFSQHTGLHSLKVSVLCISLLFCFLVAW